MLASVAPEVGRDMDGATLKALMRNASGVEQRSYARRASALGAAPHHSTPGGGGGGVSGGPGVDESARSASTRAGLATKAHTLHAGNVASLAPPAAALEAGVTLSELAQGANKFLSAMQAKAMAQAIARSGAAAGSGGDGATGRSAGAGLGPDAEGTGADRVHFRGEYYGARRAGAGPAAKTHVSASGFLAHHDRPGGGGDVSGASPDVNVGARGAAAASASNRYAIDVPRLGPVGGAHGGAHGGGGQSRAVERGGGDNAARAAVRERTRGVAVPALPEVRAAAAERAPEEDHKRRWGGMKTLSLTERKRERRIKRHYPGAAVSERPF